MSFLRGIIIAFSMFSRIPVPRTDWTDKNMRYMLCGFPLIGVVSALLILLWARLCAWLDIGAFLRAAGLTLIPVLVTGGIHLDGFCDTVDALASHAEPERKREILKDPNAGAFAVIGVCCYFVAYFALCAELVPDFRALLLLCCAYVAERCISGLSVIFFPPPGGGGLLATFRQSAEKRRTAIILLCLLALVSVCMIIIRPLYALPMLAAALISAAYLYFIAVKRFGGMSGDLAGFFLQVCELLMLAALVIMQRVDFL